MRYLPVCVLQLFVFQFVTSKILKFTLEGFYYRTKKSEQKFKTSRTKIAFTDILPKTEGQYDIYFDGKITNRMGS